MYSNIYDALYRTVPYTKYIAMHKTVTNCPIIHWPSMKSSRIPMVDPDSIFEEEEQNFHDGFVQLQNFKYFKWFTNMLKTGSDRFWDKGYLTH